MVLKVLCSILLSPVLIWLQIHTSIASIENGFNLLALKKFDADGTALDRSSPVRDLTLDCPSKTASKYKKTNFREIAFLSLIGELSFEIIIIPK